jgi:hypothetical protein
MGNEGSNFLKNFGIHLPDITVSKPGRLCCYTAVVLWYSYDSKRLLLQGTLQAPSEFKRDVLIRAFEQQDQDGTEFCMTYTIAVCTVNKS